MITTERFVGVLKMFLALEEQLVEEKGTLEWLGRRTGIGARQLGAYFAEKPTRRMPEHVEFNAVDRALCKMGLTYLWHTPPESGGFADLYEDNYEETMA
jgi:hypothetical protein